MEGSVVELEGSVCHWLVLMAVFWVVELQDF
jgi:hypothetical protein